MCVCVYTHTRARAREISRAVAFRNYVCVFYILLTVHLRIILVGNQLEALDLHTGRPLTQSDYTRCCINTVVIPRMST